jgi:hypothetical protein
LLSKLAGMRARAALISSAWLWPVLGCWACGGSSETLPDAEHDLTIDAGSHQAGDGDGKGDGDAQGDGDGDGQGDGDSEHDGGSSHGPDSPLHDGGDDMSMSGSDASASSEFDPRSFTLCKLVNDYREQNGLARVPISPALMTVAKAHVEDLASHDGLCNMHSWSEGSDVWSGCCFDISDGTCMWKKPGELTASWGAERYPGNGYEDASSATSPEGALESWKGSKAHNDVILNLDIWTGFNPWPALGCAVNDHFSVLWFGDAKDPRGSLGD